MQGTRPSASGAVCFWFSKVVWAASVETPGAGSVEQEPQEPPLTSALRRIHLTFGIGGSCLCIGYFVVDLVYFPPEVLPVFLYHTRSICTPILKDSRKKTGVVNLRSSLTIFLTTLLRKFTKLFLTVYKVCTNMYNNNFKDT